MQIMICPSDIKKNLLLKQENNKELSSIKFFSKKDFFDHYFFSYDDKAIYYLMKKYHYPIDVCKVYLEDLYMIENKKYTSSKLCFLKDLKKELIEEGLLTFTPYFKDYLKDKEIVVNHIYDLDVFQENAFSKKVEVEDVSLNFPVYEFSTMEEEVHFVCVKIRELLKKGVSLSHIFLCNVEEDYYYTIHKMFSYYNIPIMIPYHNSIYSTSVVQKYLKTGEIHLEDDNRVTKKLVSVVSRFADIEESDEKRQLILDEFKNTYFSNPIYEEAVSIKELKDACFGEEDYVFVLGLNQDHLPKIHKDVLYLSDKDLEELGNYTSSYLNKREKKVTAFLLSQIPNVFVSYKLSSPFQQYYPSSMISEYQLEVLKEEKLDLNYSDLYNKIRYSEAMDDYFLYGEKSSVLDEFQKHYDLSYQSYDHRYSGISKDLYLKNLPYPLRMSYTSLNSYNECAFKYYIQYVLKLGDFEDTFASIVGSLYHEILSLYKKNGFDLDYEWNHYLETKNLNLKDTVLLVRIRKDLEELLKVLKEQQLLTGYDEEYYEKELKVTVRDDIFVEFVGYVDKIMIYQQISDTYFTIVDYKTGTIDTHIEPMKYGLHMQLPVYLYLIHSSKVFDSPIFTGIYYQNILFSYPTWNEKVEEEKRDQFKLKGYSTDKIELLSRFDSTFEDSQYIKSMKYNPEKGFDRFSKILDDEMVYKIVEFTKKEIQNKVGKILDTEFPINPKVYGKDNISCKFCKYKDICFMKDSDLVYLDKVDDFSFLGGEE